MPATDEITLNTTSRPSTTAHPAAITQTAAGAAKGKRRRRSSGRTISASAGTVNHRVVVGGSAPSRNAPSSAITIAASTISASNPYRRTRGPRSLTE